MPTVNKAIEMIAKSHELHLLQHTNVEAIQLLDNVNLIRGLERKKPSELQSGAELVHANICVVSC